VEAGTGRHVLRRGLDPARDQSYFLFALTQDQLRRACFPVGGLTKPEVRAMARERGLRVADKPDSHEICFVADNDYAAFIERRTGGAVPREGPICDQDGRVLGRHRGVHHYTVGQRKGLGLATGTPLYVIALEPASQTVVVGERAALERDTMPVADVTWSAGAPPGGPFRALVQIRHGHRAAPALVTPCGSGRAQVRFDTPQSAVAPGQAAVFYDGDVVRGGGWIDRRGRTDGT
jgi:tRNA-specific 2-thiouridylase